MIVEDIMKKKVLILFAHPALEKSRVNKALISDINLINGLHFHDLYECYPDFHIDIETEQRLLTEHDVIAFMYPLYWYSTPAIIKEWQDLVLTHGWAFGHEGNELKGKTTVNIITTGGPKEAFFHDDENHFTMQEFLSPIEQTARVCKMNYVQPFTIHSTFGITDEILSAEKSRLYQFLNEIMNS